MVRDRQRRYTFESVRENSRILREKILSLVEYNTPVDRDEKRMMLDLLDRATMGIGTEPVVLQLVDEGYNVIRLKDFQHFVRCLIDYDHSIVNSDFFVMVAGKEYYGMTYDIGILWKVVLYNLNHFIPKALDSAARMSKEVISDRKEVKTVSTVKE
jgi:hypothetical protein